MRQVRKGLAAAIGLLMIIAIAPASADERLASALRGKTVWVWVSGACIDFPDRCAPRGRRPICATLSALGAKVKCRRGIDAKGPSQTFYRVFCNRLPSDLGKRLHAYLGLKGRQRSLIEPEADGCRRVALAILVPESAGIIVAQPSDPIIQGKLRPAVQTWAYQRGGGQHRLRLEATTSGFRVPLGDWPSLNIACTRDGEFAVWVDFIRTDWKVVTAQKYWIAGDDVVRANYQLDRGDDESVRFALRSPKSRRAGQPRFGFFKSDDARSFARKLASAKRVAIRVPVQSLKEREKTDIITLDFRVQGLQAASTAFPPNCQIR